VVHADPPLLVIALEPPEIVLVTRISRSPVATPAGSATVPPVIEAVLTPLDL
jgi:hypothetical protein